MSEQQISTEQLQSWRDAIERGDAKHIGPDIARDMIDEILDARKPASLTRAQIDATDGAAELAHYKIRDLWRSFGGGQHGPHIETYTIPETDFYKFADALIVAASPSPALRASGGVTEAMAEALRAFLDASKMTYPDGTRGHWRIVPDLQNAARLAETALEASALPQPVEGSANSHLQKVGDVKKRLWQTVVAREPCSDPGMMLSVSYADLRVILGDHDGLEQATNSLIHHQKRLAAPPSQPGHTAVTEAMVKAAWIAFEKESKTKTYPYYIRTALEAALSAPAPAAEDKFKPAIELLRAYQSTFPPGTERARVLLCIRQLERGRLLTPAEQFANLKRALAEPDDETDLPSPPEKSDGKETK